MIAQAAIAWAVIATVGAVAVYALMRLQMRVWRSRFWKCVSLARDAQKINSSLIEISTEAESKLAAIRQQRHLAAKKARAAQVAQQRARVLAKAGRLAAR